MAILSGIINFPYPDREARARVWTQCLPAGIPSAELDLAALAEADLAGGAISAAALQAAYLAADDGRVLTMAHLREAVMWELAKSGRVGSTARPHP